METKQGEVRLQVCWPWAPSGRWNKCHHSWVYSVETLNFLISITVLQWDSWYLTQGIRKPTTPPSLAKTKTERCRFTKLLLLDALWNSCLSRSAGCFSAHCLKSQHTPAIFPSFSLVPQSTRSKCTKQCYACAGSPSPKISSQFEQSVAHTLFSSSK